MSRKGMGGAIKDYVTSNAGRGKTRKEKDKEIITCGICGETKVAKGNYYFYKTTYFDKRYGKYYRTEAYKRWCIPCSNAYDRNWAKTHKKQNATHSIRSYRRKRHLSRGIRFVEGLEDYSYKPTQSSLDKRDK